MKLLKNLIVFGVSLVFAGSCFNPPEFPLEPKIEFVDWYFKDSPDLSDDDSLVVTISFQDGDGDLGLASDDGTVYRYRIIGITDEDRLESYPFHENDFFVDDGTKLYPISELSPGSVNSNMKITTKAASDRISLPDFYAFPGKCKNYMIDSALVSGDLRSTLEDDMILGEYFSGSGKPYYLIADTFYVEPNPRYYNIDVKFFTQGENPADDDPHDDPDDGWEELDWESIYNPECGTSFSARFPLIADDDKSTPKEGNIEYAMRSSGLNPVLGTRIFRLEIFIRDRAGHVSNTVISPANSLENLRR